MKTPQEELVDSLKVEWEKLSTDLLGKVQQQIAEVKTLGVALPETKETIAKMTVRIDEMEKQILKAVDDFNTKLNRPGIFANQNEKQDPKAAPRYKAYSKLLRYGPSLLVPEEKKLIKRTIRRVIETGAEFDTPELVEEVKVLTESDDTGGGYLAPPEFVQEIIKAIILVSPVRADARIRTTSQRTVRIPKRTGTFAAVWTGETATRAETTGLTYGMEELPIHEMYALADISNQDLEDSAFDLNAELNQEFSEQFAKAEGNAFVVGDAIGKPEGFMTNAGVAADVTGSAAALTYAGYVTLVHNLKSAYAQNAVLVMNRKTIGATRAIVDSVTGRPIWTPFSDSGLSIANPPTILNSPYREYPDMPDVGASTYPVAFGDFKRGYIIVDRIALEIQRDPYTQNLKGITRFIGRKRVGGQVVLVEAIRKLQCHT